MVVSRSRSAAGGRRGVLSLRAVRVLSRQVMEVRSVVLTLLE